LKQFAPIPLTYFYLSRPAPCPYLPGKTEQMVFTDLASAGDPAGLHDQLSRAGFRRSQGIAYKPNCRGCNACTAVRVEVDGFRRNRSLNRVWRRNAHLTARVLPAQALLEHYDLFRRYVVSRHGDGGMAGMSFEDYTAMVHDSPVPTRVIEFRDPEGDLAAACLTDILDDGLSLVYSFFDPSLAGDSLGTHMILWHIEHARQKNLPFVYLGYWIPHSTKMAYKERFRPMNAYRPDVGWDDFDVVARRMRRLVDEAKT
jgi:arginyl-tRNA--protein-N-Asp/Glu arginylyltransferase